MAKKTYKGTFTGAGSLVSKPVAGKSSAEGFIEINHQKIYLPEDKQIELIIDGEGKKKSKGKKK